MSSSKDKGMGVTTFSGSILGDTPSENPLADRGPVSAPSGALTDRPIWLPEWTSIWLVVHPDGKSEACTDEDLARHELYAVERAMGGEGLLVGPFILAVTPTASVGKDKGVDEAKFSGSRLDAAPSETPLADRGPVSAPERDNPFVDALVHAAGGPAPRPSEAWTSCPDCGTKRPPGKPGEMLACLTCNNHWRALVDLGDGILLTPEQAKSRLAADERIAAQARANDPRTKEAQPGYAVDNFGRPRCVKCNYQDVAGHAPDCDAVEPCPNEAKSVYDKPCPKCGFTGGLTHPCTDSPLPVCGSTFWDSHGVRRICVMPKGHADHWDDETRPRPEPALPRPLKKGDLVRRIGYSEEFEGFGEVVDAEMHLIGSAIGVAQQVPYVKVRTVMGWSTSPAEYWQRLVPVGQDSETALVRDIGCQGCAFAAASGPYRCVPCSDKEAYAAADAAFEASAKVCDDIYSDRVTGFYRNASHACAQAIRSLRSTPTGSNDRG